MAGEQGTGKHPHKSAAEPYEHHEAPTTKGEHKAESHSSGSHSSSHSTASHSNGSHKSEASSESHSGEQGTGKHPHKKASDPKEHHESAKK